MKGKDKRSENWTALRYGAVFFSGMLALLLVNEMTGEDSALLTAGQWFGLIAGTAFCAVVLIGAVRSLIRERKAVKGKAEEACANTAQAPAARKQEREAQGNMFDLRFGECRPIDQIDPQGRAGLPYDIRMAMAITRFLGERGFVMRKTCIGGGATEVSHTGAVEYGASYNTAEQLLANAESDYWQAEKEAAQDYRNWFTGLNYSFVRQEFAKGENIIRTDIVVEPKVWWEGEEAQEAARELERWLRRTGTDESTLS